MKNYAQHLAHIPDMAATAVNAARDTKHTFIIYYNDTGLWLARAETFEDIQPGIGIARATDESTVQGITDEAKKWLKECNER